MTKPRRDSLLSEGERLLANWGVAAKAGSADLDPLTGREPAGDLAIAHRLGVIVKPESVPLLQRIEGATRDKLVKKEAKRALYRLQQRGIELPKADPAPVSTPVLLPPAEGVVSPIDGRGDQLVWLIKPRSGSLGHLFAVINDPEGLREVEFNLITRKGLKALRAELIAKHELEFVEADAQYCDFLMNRAFQWARARDTRMKGDYTGQRAQIMKEPPPESLPPLIFSRLAPDTIKADEQLVPGSGALLEEKEFRTWFLNEETCRPYLEDMKGIKDSPLVLSATQQKNRFETCVTRAVGELFDGEHGESYVRRLQEMAYFLLRTKREDQAKRALAVSLALADSDGGGTAIPFCESLIRGSLATCYATAAEEETEHQKNSLLVTPQQFAAERQHK